MWRRLWDRLTLIWSNVKAVHDIIYSDRPPKVEIHQSNRWLSLKVHHCIEQQAYDSSTVWFVLWWQFCDIYYLCKVMLQVSLGRVLGMMAFVTNFTKLCDIPWHVTVVTLWRLTIHPVLRRILGMMMFFFDKLTVLCDTTWHVTVVTLCRVTIHLVLRRIWGMMMLFFDKLTVLCETTWHVTVVTLCRVTMHPVLRKIFGMMILFFGQVNSALWHYVTCDSCDPV